MIIALFADPASSRAVAERLESQGHACMLAEGSIPGEADCVVVVGDAGGGDGLVDAAEEAGLARPQASVGQRGRGRRRRGLGLGLADERYIDAAAPTRGSGGWRISA